ncbi:hypothetical protein, partial [Candidatus Albibeggiatoa sp. nov. BB20]|uniref:hypothetical protein n=1 Tax=Candidatus Albibeggiatoa sp. nov. BB20 TaxID=3162723 RepID=UPI0033656E69
MQWLVLIILIFLMPSSYALEAIKLNIGSISAEGWKANKVDINLSKLQRQKPILDVKVKQFDLDSLKKPLYNLQVSCSQLKSTIKAISCANSQLNIQDKYLGKPKGKFDFSYSPDTQIFNALLKQFKIASGSINMDFQAKLADWKTTIKTQTVAISQLITYKNRYIDIPLP